MADVDRYELKNRAERLIGKETLSAGHIDWTSFKVDPSIVLEWAERPPFTMDKDGLSYAEGMRIVVYKQAAGIGVRQIPGDWLKLSRHEVGNFPKVVAVQLQMTPSWHARIIHTLLLTGDPKLVSHGTYSSFQNDPTGMIKRFAESSREQTANDRAAFKRFLASITLRKDNSPNYVL